MDAIISALVSAAAAIIVCIVSHNRTVAVLEVKIEQLTEQVRKHNQLVERTFKLEELTAIQEEKIKAADKRIDDLERREP